MAEKNRVLLELRFFMPLFHLFSITNISHDWLSFRTIPYGSGQYRGRAHLAIIKLGFMFDLANHERNQITILCRQACGELN